MKNTQKTNLIIVESPTKAKTISSFLGSGYSVLSSYGHVRDLPTNKFDKKTRFGIDIEHDFEPQYVIPAKAKENVAKLQKAAKKATGIILATDEDREGEAIAWHLAETLGLNGTSQIANRKSKKNKDDMRQATSDKPVLRIAFHEITKPAIQEALEHPREINMPMVNAQQARRVLDRLAGYELSQFLWHKVKYGLSAGRVQSAALRLMCEQEARIDAFKQTDYHVITALLAKKTNGKATKQEFTATLFKINYTQIPEPGILEKERAESIREKLTQSEFIVHDVQNRQVSRSALSPFTTSTLQQSSWQKLHFSAKQTMVLAQQLYEQGFITYMRTDSTNLSTQAVTGARAFIEKEYGKEYVPARFNTYKTKSKLAQEAHEAIRATDAFKTPDLLSKTLDARQLKLYALIWSRFIACQMEKAILAQQSVLVLATSKNTQETYELKANGQSIVFDGFLKTWNSVQKQDILPAMAKGDALSAVNIEIEQHATQPPPRYNDASLVKTLEELGIGRPSTYASIINTIITRGYVERTQTRSLAPTGLGKIVNELLTAHFPSIVDYAFTAQKEDELDEVAQGKRIWHTVIKEFYTPFHALVEQKEQEVSRREATERPSEERCDKCGAAMVTKWGRYGQFLACSNYPACSNIKKIPKQTQDIGLACPKCGATEGGKVVMRKTKARGRMFYGCSRWPQCDFASWKKPDENEELVEKE